MKPLLFCLLTAAIGNCLYHLGLKSADIQGNPMRALSLYYAFAFILSLAAAPFFGPLKLSDGLVSAATDWRIWLVAAGMVLIELGFFLAYRSGGPPPRAPDQSASAPPYRSPAPHCRASR